MAKRILYRLIFVGVLLFFIIWGGLVIAANADAAEPYEERIYVSVPIEADDTLWSIAQRYCERGSISSYVSDLMEINGITNAKALHPGANLIVYHYN